MSEKFKDGWRKVKDVLSLFVTFIPIILLAVAFVIIGAVVRGAIVSVCWNICMPAIFGFQKVTIFQAFILALTIGCLRADYFDEAKSEYAKLKEVFFSKSKNEWMSKTVAVIVISVFQLVSILIAVWLTMYSWNNILPWLLNVELVQIDFWQSLGFAYLFNLFFGISKSDDKESKDKENKEVAEEEVDTKEYTRE